MRRYGVLGAWLRAGAWLLMASTTLANQCMEMKNGLPHSYETCGECLQKTGDGCGWCPSVQNKTNVVGCVPVSRKSTCKDNQGRNIFEEGTTIKTPVSNIEVTKNGQVNISPQKYSVKARPNVKVDVKFTAKKDAVSVEIYFLVDQSNSMAGERNTLARLSTSLGERIQKLTPKGYKLGFGAFFEKPIPPFSQRLKDRDYDFIHYLSLINDTQKFEDMVKSSALQGNHDTPEAGLDALMQVILCKEEIGWTDDITHIIVLLTDAPYHFAGDGILAGIWKPYDSTKCNLVKKRGRHVYNSLEHDYPSLSEVNYWLAQKKKNLIFGTASVVTKLYEDLGTTGTLRSTAGDMGDGEAGSDQKMLDLVTNEYEKIKDSIQIVSSDEDFIKVTVSSDCKKKKSEANRFTCEGITVDESVSFTAQIELKPEICKSASGKHEVTVEVPGQGNSKLTIEVEPICECGCEKDGPKFDPDNRCQNAEGIMCGACKCKNKYSGEFCQCQEGTAGSKDDRSKCMDDNNRECGGRGKCECGECKCDSGYSGQFCQCELRHCKKLEDCSGHGSCKCEGKSMVPICKCYQGWGGGKPETCACKLNFDGTPDEEVCIDPFSSGNEVCNGESHGGSCECFPEGRRCHCSAIKEVPSAYRGDFCQKHPTNSDQEACDKAEPCVLLSVFGKSVDATQENDWKDRCAASKLQDILRCRKIYTSNNKDTDINNNTFTGVKIYTSNIKDTGINNNTFTEDIEEDLQQEQTSTKDLDIYENDCETYRNDPPKLHSPCTVVYAGCTLEYYHDGILDYSYETRLKKKNFYIRFYEDQDKIQQEKKWTPINCTSFSLTYTVGITVGVLLFIGAVLFFTYAILINLRDKWEYERFLAMQKDAFTDYDESKPTIYKGKESSTRKRLSRMSLKN